MLAGALLSASGVATVAVVISRPEKARCIPYFLIPAEQICGQSVVWVNPDGSRVVIGRTGQLRPMPRAPARR